ncbi:hypothetical protein [Hahella sp. CR1]|uniref:hypothetical protein n=1 Tax=unclassified Hahella TaxID=2624107 RepID=UPI0024428323|nr:hypothetical protein [Hahella sp. CR1]MDG9671916.1 hypothetical protein [Hahella sp. CR1]
MDLIPKGTWRTLLCLLPALGHPVAHSELKPMADQEMGEISAQSALEFSATDINYNLSQLTGIEFIKNPGIGFTRVEQRTQTESVDATVYRLQLNGSGELHAFAEELTLGDYGGANNSIYKDENGQGVPDVALRNFGFGKSAQDPFVFEDPYLEIQKQHHADGTDTIRGIRFGFGRVDGSTPVTIDSISGYIPALSIMADLGGLVRSQIYGSGTKDTFVNIIGYMPDGSGNYPQTPAPGEWVCNGGMCGFTPDNVGLTGNAGIGYSYGGKELNLSNVTSLDYHNVKNFYISFVQGAGNLMSNQNGSINGAMWSQHLEGIIPDSRPDLPGWNFGIPFNDPNHPTDGYLEAHTDVGPTLQQIFFGVGDDNPRMGYQNNKLF